MHVYNFLSGSSYFARVPEGTGVAIISATLRPDTFRNCQCLTFDYYLVQGSLKVKYMTTQFDIVEVFSRRNGNFLFYIHTILLRDILVRIFSEHNSEWRGVEMTLRDSTGISFYAYGSPNHAIGLDNVLVSTCVLYVQKCLKLALLGLLRYMIVYTGICAFYTLVISYC